jgi:glycogen debranching enzyme
MSEYVAGLGKIFDGVRIDNAHSTPMHIAKYLLAKLRSANPNSYVLAEFFTNSRESEAEATRELGINGLIREMQNYGNCKDLSTQCHSYGGCQEQIIGKINDYYLDYSTDKSYRRIKQRYPLPVFYDMTHDNESTIQKYPPGTISLPHLALGSVL